MTAERYLIVNEASDGESFTYRAHTPGGLGRWAQRIASATRWAALADARAELDAIERQRDRAGRRFIAAEIDTPAGPAHREVSQ